MRLIFLSSTLRMDAVTHTHTHNTITIISYHTNLISQSTIIVQPLYHFGTLQSTILVLAI